MTNYRKLIPVLWILFILISITYSFSETKKSSPGIKKNQVQDAERKVRLSWEEVDGAVSYKFILRDSKGKVVFSRDIDGNNIVVEVQPGNYSIRIGAVNKFNKIGSWSDWADITIEKPKVVQKEEVVKKPVKTEMFNIGLKLGAGMSYFYILPDWDKYYKDSYEGFSLNIAYSFRHHSSPGFFAILKYTGFDIEIDYIKFDGRQAFNRVESDLTNIITGASLFVSTNFTFPLNFAIRGGGGLAYTAQDYQKYNNLGDPADSGTSSTLDYFYKGGISVEYRFYYCFFIEAYADYYVINYLANDFKSYRFAALIGIRL